MRRHWWMKGVAFLICAPAFLALMSLVVMWLWNALVPSLFAGPALGFWQAVGLLLLCRILFGGFRRVGPPGWGHHRHRGMEIRPDAAAVAPGTDGRSLIAGRESRKISLHIRLLVCQ